MTHRLQVSTKHGDSIYVIGADTVGELRDSLAQALGGETALTVIADMIEAFGPKPEPAPYVPPAQPAAAPPRQQSTPPPAATPPYCGHNLPRNHVEAKPGSGKTWKAQFCGAPQGTPDHEKCDPIWLSR